MVASALQVRRTASFVPREHWSMNDALIVMRGISATKKFCGITYDGILLHTVGLLNNAVNRLHGDIDYQHTSHRAYFYD